MTDDQRDPLVGGTLARYKILERVAAGGMGEVYRAEDPVLQRFVAVKVLSPMIMADRQATERIYHEALAASALSHPNICAVYDFGTDRDRSFIVMELLEGRTLRELISQSRLPIEQDAVNRQTDRRRPARRTREEDHPPRRQTSKHLCDTPRSRQDSGLRDRETRGERP